MQQMNNIIRIEENGASVPYVVHERVSHWANVQEKPGCKYIRGVIGGMPIQFVCEPITDAEWSEVSFAQLELDFSSGDVVEDAIVIEGGI